MADLNVRFKLDSIHGEFHLRMNEFRTQKLFCDVVLDVDGKQFPCHRLILTAMSPYFRAMFDGNFKESSSQLVALKEIEPEIMDQILDIIYTAHIHLTPQKVYSILKTSHLLQFESIVNACVDCIERNPQIHYLIEIYLFATKMALHKLSAVCAQALADDLIHWGKTDVFTELPFEDLNLILSKGNYALVKDEVLIIILKWCKFNNANAKNVRALLQSANLGSNMIGSAAMAQFIVSGESELVSSFSEEKNAEEGEVEMNIDCCINLYLKTTDVKTGAKGWGVLQVNDSLDKYTLSNYYSSDCCVQSVHKIGTKLYCFEKGNVGRKRRVFSHYEGNERTELNVPNGLISDTSYKPYNYPSISMVSMKNSIYLTCKGDENIWNYNCELGKWKKAFQERVQYSWNSALKDTLYTCNRIALTSLDNVLFVVGSKSMTYFDTRTPTSKTKVSLQSDSDQDEHHNCAICSFDGKIFLSGSNHDHTLHNTFFVFDTRANKYMTLKPMNSGRANHKLIHRGDSIYAVENSPFATTNEMYDINSNIWIELPSLPKRMLLKGIDGTSTAVATGYVFDADAVPISDPVE